MGSDCVFCKIAKGEIKSEKLVESDNFFVIRDINPDAEGHSLVISKKHFVTLLDMPDKLGGEMIKMIKRVASDLMDAKLGDGFNLVMNNLEVAGQLVMHAHIHVIPRKEGDGIRLVKKIED
jgi:histidine triad (HIT) family protein